MSSKVLAVGCGLAGPVIALQLKQKGYHPIVLEKVKELGDAGASLMMMPNGLKVLSLINFDKTVTESAPHLRELCELASSGRQLGSSDAPSHWKESYGQPACGIKRTTLNLALKKALTDAEVELHEGWKLKDVIEKSDSVTAISEHGEIIKASFLIGCDGIKSISRTLIVTQHGVKEEKPSYTGLTQTAGISPTPLGLNSNPGRLNIYGPGAHFICYPISSTTTSWAITQRDLTAAQETWRSFGDEELVDQREKLLDFFKEWSSPVPELIRGAERLIKYGLYDRSHLQPEQWVSKGGRCVLIGDAAHPTSPHLGQGANQALEDCYHLSRSLPDFDPQHPLDSKTLFEVLSKFARLRQPRTAALVKGARAQGEDRVVDGGLAACAERDQRIHLAWQNEEAMKASFDALLKEPFCP